MLLKTVAHASQKVVLESVRRLRTARTLWVRYRVSAAGRARIAAAPKARWAKQRKAEVIAAKPAKKRRRTLSPEGRARIIAAQKAWWVKAKANNR